MEKMIMGGVFGFTVAFAIASISRYPQISYQTLIAIFIVLFTGYVFAFIKK